MVDAGEKVSAVLRLRWLVPGVLALGLVICVPGAARAVSFTFLPSAEVRAADDLTPVVYEVFLNADGHTGGIALVDAYFTLSDLSLISFAGATPTGNTSVAPGASLNNAEVFFTASDVLTLMPTPTGTEQIKLGELAIIHAGIEDTLDIMVDTVQSQVFDTLDFDTRLPITHSNGQVLASLQIFPAGGVPVPEPAPQVLVLASLVALWLLRKHSIQ